MQSDEWTQWIQQLASKDWREAAEAEKQLSDAGEIGMQAVLVGMSHTNSRIRQACVGFMDHHGDDRCLVGLIERMLDDPVPHVRRRAVHSLSCDCCKPSPLSADRVPLLMSVIENDPNKGVRYEAIWALHTSRHDPRYFVLLRRIVDAETDKGLRKLAHSVLYHNDADYKSIYAAQMRAEQNARQERSCVAARAG